MDDHELPLEIISEEPKKKRSKKTEVTWLHERQGYSLCLVGESGYYVPSSLCDTSKGLVFEVDLSDESVIPLYDWTQEIEDILPSRAEIIHNIRKALWVNGAVSRESAKQNTVQKNLMRGAFPYRIKLDKENS